MTGSSCCVSELADDELSLTGNKQRHLDSRSTLRKWNEGKKKTERKAGISAVSVLTPFAIRFVHYTLPFSCTKRSNTEQ